jgi:hypothetical protein
MIILLPETKDDLIAVRVTGKARQEDNNKILPLLEQAINQYGKIRMFVEIENLEGVEWKSILSGLRFDIKHINDFRKVAVVGDTEWEKWITNFAKPLTSADIRYFDSLHREEAMMWILIRE